MLAKQQFIGYLKNKGKDALHTLRFCTKSIIYCSLLHVNSTLRVPILESINYMILKVNKQTYCIFLIIPVLGPDHLIEMVGVLCLVWIFLC